MAASVRAIVQKTIANGAHGPYAIATSEAVTGSITFSLDPKIWKERDVPEEGVRVLLSDLREKRKGWRAMSARYSRPDDN